LADISSKAQLEDFPHRFFVKGVVSINIQLADWTTRFPSCCFPRHHPEIAYRSQPYFDWRISLGLPQEAAAATQKPGRS
jgi:hypothetical protein